MHVVCCSHAASGQPPQTTVALPPAAPPPAALRLRSQRGKPTLATSAAGSPHTAHVCSVVSISVVSMYFHCQDYHDFLLLLMVLNLLASSKTNFFYGVINWKPFLVTSFFFAIEWLPCFTTWCHMRLRLYQNHTLEQQTTKEHSKRRMWCSHLEQSNLLF